MAMYIPTPIEFSGKEGYPAVYEGGTFEVMLELYKNAAHTERENLETPTNYTVEVQVEGFSNLTEASGLTVVKSEGKITMTITAANTATYPVGTVKNWAVKLVSGSKVYYPVSGTMLWSAP
jgi:hypothetical protein